MIDIGSKQQNNNHTLFNLSTDTGGHLLTPKAPWVSGIIILLSLCVY